MRRDRQPASLLGGVLATALAAILLAACTAPPSSRPVADKTIEIANITPITGGTAAAEQIVLGALQDYVKYFNEEKGIPRAHVELLWVDTAMERSKFISAYRRFVDRGVVFMFSDDGIGLAGIMPQLEHDQVAFYSGGVSKRIIDPPGWVYCPWPTFGECATGVLDYFMESWQQERPARVVYFGPEHLMGRGASEAAAVYLERSGLNMELLPWEFLPYVVVDATPQLLRAKDSGADLVMVQQILCGTAPVLMDAERLGLLDEMQFAGLEFAVGQTLIDMVGPACEGYLTVRATPWFDETDVPGIRTIHEVQERYHGQVRRDPEYMGGWLGGAIMCEAIKRATDEVGLDDLSGLAVKQALDLMKDFDVDGIATIDYTEQRRGSLMIAPYQVRDGKIVRISDWHEAPILVP